MADEVVEQASTEPVVEETQVETPHPLAPGGPRFEEVYRNWKETESARQRLEAENAALRTQHQAPQSQPQQFTSEQVASYLQQQVDQGALTPMAAANTLSQFNAQRVATATALQVEQARQHATRLHAAGQEVNQYIDRIPTLRDTTSAEFITVRDAAYSASEDMGLPVSDLRVQRRALREVYGSLDKLAKSSGDRESNRRASLPHVETSTSGNVTVPPKVDDTWRKDVPERFLAFWKQRGYTEAQMKDEAKYIKPRVKA